MCCPVQSALDLPLSLKEQLALLAAIMGHLLIIMAQKATKETEQGDFIEQGPYTVVRYPHLIGVFPLSYSLT